jgi:hypothetical protein
MTDLFGSPRFMLDRGKHHVEELDARKAAFFSDKPWSRVVEKDSDGVTDLHKIKFDRRVTDGLPGIVFDAANNLRSVLDQLGFAVAVAYTGDANPTSCKFPFGPTEGDMLNNAKGACKNLPPEIRDVFVGFSPYKGGNDLLWALNELANTPKHKLIVPVIIGGGGSTAIAPVGQVTVTDRFISYYQGPMRVHTPVWDSNKNEIVFMTVPNGQQFRYNANVTISVTFDNSIQIIGGKDPVQTLRLMAGIVERIFMTTEAECRRIGLGV